MRPRFPNTKETTKLNQHPGFSCSLTLQHALLSSAVRFRPCCSFTPGHALRQATPAPHLSLVTTELMAVAGCGRGLCTNTRAAQCTALRGTVGPRLNDSQDPGRQCNWLTGRGWKPVSPCCSKHPLWPSTNLTSLFKLRFKPVPVLDHQPAGAGYFTLIIPHPITSISLITDSQ